MMLILHFLPSFASFLPFPSFISMEEQLADAIFSGLIHDVEPLLKHPQLDVNWADESGSTALHHASYNGQTEIVKLLLAHPAINVNVKNQYGVTSLSQVCLRSLLPVLELLLRHHDVDLTLADENNRTPLWYAAANGHLDVIECLVASGKDLGDLDRKGEYYRNTYTALEIARRLEEGEVKPLLERLMANLAQTRHEIRVKLGVLDALAAGIFALTVFLCDDLLQLKPASHLAAIPDNAAAAIRFFTIASKLPWSCR